MRLHLLPALLIGALAAPTGAYGLHDPGRHLFAESSVLEVELPVDFSALCRPRETDDCTYTPTTLRYGGELSPAGEVAVEVKVRGGWRSLSRNCSVPLLWVRFDPESARGTPFEGQELLPLTTHCGKGASLELSGSSARRSDFEQYLLREYLGHQVYNRLTELSLRTRLLRINYGDAGVFGRPTPHYAFFTEHFDALAERVGAVREERGLFDAKRLEPQSAAVLALFQFLIGNTDWSIARERNILLLTRDGLQWPVPYDLDMSGLVDAHYAGPAPGLPIDSVRERYFLGYCQPGTDWDGLFAHFGQARAGILDLPGSIPGLSRKSRRSTTRFLDGFFSLLDDPAERTGHIIEHCQPWPPSGVDHTTPPEERAPADLAGAANE